MKLIKTNALVNAYWVMLIFCLGFFIRGLPELLSGPYPVGYDLLAGYAPSILALPETYPLRLFGWLWSSLSIFILWFFWRVSHTNLFFFLKIASPVFYGLFVASFYYLLSKGLEWNRKKSFLTALLFLLQPAVLRTAWDQLRLMLGLSFLFFLLAETKCDIVLGMKKSPLKVVFLSVFLVLSQQLTAVLFFVIVFWQVVKSWFESKRSIIKMLFVLFPSVIIFVFQLYFTYVDPDFNSHFFPINLPYGPGFVNYFISDPRFIGGNYFTILAYVGNLSLYVIALLIPLAVKGFFKDKVFLPMLAWLLAASYSIIVFPWFALSHYWFWTFLLPIPLTVYAGNSFEKMGGLARKNTKKLVFGFLLLGVVGFGYATSVISIGYPLGYSYMPPGLVKSCVNFKDIPSIKAAFLWANTHLPNKSIVVVPERFQGFASMYSSLDLRIQIAPALIDFNYLIEKIIVNESQFYAIFALDEVESNKKSVTLAEFGKVGIYNITSSK
jgi:hypothetical protein